MKQDKLEIRNNTDQALGEKAEKQENEPIFRNLRKEEMQHEETMIKHATNRTKFRMISAIAIALIILVGIGFIVYSKTHISAVQDRNVSTVDILISQGKFDDARDEAKKLYSRATNITEAIEFRFEVKRELDRIKRKEAEWNLANNITIGRASKSFTGMNYEDVQKDLVGRGFSKKNIIFTKMTDIPRKYKNAASGTVIGIKIDGDEKFKAKDSFAPDSVIEIFYVK